MNKVLRYAISLGLLGLVVWLADVRAIGATLREVHLGWVGAALALALFDRVVLNYRWQVLLQPRGVRIGFWALLKVQLAANFLGSFLPSSIGVDAIRIAALRARGESTAAVIAATLVDRFSLVLATFIFGSINIVLFATTRLPEGVSRLVLVATAVGVGGCALLLSRRVRAACSRLLLARLPDRLRSVARDVADASLAYRRETGSMSRVLVATLVAFAVRIAFAKAVAASCGFDLPVTALLVLIPILWIVVMLPITIGGLGVQEAGYVALMAVLGVPAAAAVSMSVVEHVIARLASLPGALFIHQVGARPQAVRQ